ncbi:MAG: hypothetical protein A2031_08750 [Deltaproteobacteria bacterium RBG_19FT_COMBO_43_11]|nr:MAG: hypothetical protein A2031_08750 [Deltaproteobacteria bacterium RBG_19FT_COMBO_43_11]
MKRFHKSIIFDFRLGILLTLLALLAVFFFGTHLERLEYGLYDLSSRFHVKSSAAPVAVIAIDEKSLANFGPWPWPRSYIAFMIDLLESYEAKVIGLDIMYSGKDLNHGLKEVLNIINTIENNPQYSRKNMSTIVLLAALKDAERRLDNDAILASSIASSKKVVLPFFFILGKSSADDSRNFPDYLGNNYLFPFSFDDSISARQIVTPITPFAKDSLAMGHVNVIADSDGTVRSEPLFINYNDRIFASFSLQLTLAYLNLDLHDIKFGKELTFGSKTIPMLRHNKMLITFKSDIPYYSFLDVINKKIPAEVFKDKIVIIAPSIPVFGAIQVTPTTFNVPAAKITANVIDNIISNDYILRPKWAPTLELMIIFFFGLYIAFVIPYLQVKISALLSVFLFAAWLSFSAYLLVTYGYWIKAVYPSCLLLFGYIIIVSKRYQFTIE